MSSPRSLSHKAEALMERLGLSYDQLLGMRFAVNVFIATAIVWFTLQVIDDTNPIWAIAAMVAASDPHAGGGAPAVPEPDRQRAGRLRGRLLLCPAGRRSPLDAPLRARRDGAPLSSYVIRIKTMWRQAPITAAVIVAAGISQSSTLVGIERGLHKVAEVLFGCIVGVLVSWLMSKVWLVRPRRPSQPNGHEPRLDANQVAPDDTEVRMRQQRRQALSRHCPL